MLDEDEKEENELLIEDLKSSGIVDETALIKSSSFANSISDTVSSGNSLAESR